MKAVYFQTAGAIALTFGIAACVSVPDVPASIAAPSPAPEAQPAPVSAPSPAPVSATQTAPPAALQEPQFDNYLDAPQTPGTWTYSDDSGETLATFGVEANYRFIVRCDKSTSQIGLGRVAETASSASRAMDITTETTSRTLMARPLTRAGRLIAVELPPRDPLLDAMAITKGRFAVGVEGERTLYLPAWAEVTRVIEDCR